jgi:penicillin-binding protein 1A
MQKTFYVHGPAGLERFVVHNDEGAYAGSDTLTGATAFSDNSIYAEVGLKVGTRRIARVARAMGITTPLSTNAAMTIGGLTVGVTPLDMAHAYETIAHGGERVSGSLAGERGAPVGIQEVSSATAPLPDGSRAERNRVETARVLPESVASTETSMLEGVVQYGTGRAAAIGQFAAGKTGTTSNYGDAWFVGWDSKYTVAVWVGYPAKLVPMTSDFNGGPVLGGTFPALIWHNFMVSALGIDKARAEHAANASSRSQGAAAGAGEATGTGASTSPAPAPSGRSQPKPSGSGAAGGGEGSGSGTPAHSETPAPSAPAPARESPPATPAPAAPPSAPPAPSSGGASTTGGVSPSG